MQLMTQLFSHFAPTLLKQRANLKGPPFEEVVLPVKLQNYIADISSLGGFLIPNQLMANYVSKEPAKEKSRFPAIRLTLTILPKYLGRISAMSRMWQLLPGPYPKLIIQLRSRNGLAGR